MTSLHAPIRSAPPPHTPSASAIAAQVAGPHHSSVLWHPTTPVEQLGEAIAELASRIHAATYELLVMLREFDASAGWNNGFLSCAHWLSWRTGIDPGAAREKVRVARALTELPRVSAAMHRGEVSYAKVRALTRVATPENEAQLLDVAYAGTAAHVERVVRAWRRCDSVQAAREADCRHLHRELHTWIDDDGMVVVHGRLTPELGAVVQRALLAATDRLFRESSAAASGETIIEEVTPAQRRADALGLLAECALAANLDSGTAGDRYQVVLHVEAAADSATSHAVLELQDHSVDVSAETSRRIACDVSVMSMHHAPGGSVLDVGRKARSIPPALRRAHHLRHWMDGGATSLDNLILLCRRHHWSVHEGRVAVTRNGNGCAVFHRTDGRLIVDAPRPPAWHAQSDAEGPLGPPTAWLERMGIAINAHTAPCWDGTPFRLGDAIDVRRGHEPVGIESRESS
jgi:hypothetical protein